jgi:Ca2+-transporting ATPase
MVAFQVFHVGNSRSEHESAFRKPITSNRFLFFGVLITVIVHVLALYVPPTQSLLRLQPLELASWLRIVVVASSIVLVVEFHKRMRSAHPSRQQPSASSS